MKSIILAAILVFSAFGQAPRFIPSAKQAGAGASLGSFKSQVHIYVSPDAADGPFLVKGIESVLKAAGIPFIYPVDDRISMFKVPPTADYSGLEILYRDTLVSKGLALALQKALNPYIKNIRVSDSLKVYPASMDVAEPYLRDQVVIRVGKQ